MTPPINRLYNYENRLTNWQQGMQMHSVIMIHHLDLGEESDELVDCLKKDGIIPEFDYQLPDYDVNEITIDPGEDEDINRLEMLLKKLSTDTINTIFEMGLSISLYIHAQSDPSATSGISHDGIYLNTDILRLLADKQIGIFIVSMSGIEES